MKDGSLLVDASTVTVHPRLGTGWEITLNQIDRQISMQLKVFWIRLPLKRRIPYSLIERVGTVCRDSWRSRKDQALPGWVGIAFFGIGSFSTRTEMPTEGWRYDVLVTSKGGKTVKLATVKDPDTANGIEQKLRQRFGIQEIH